MTRPTVRPEQPSDLLQVRDVVTRAFGQSDEAALLDALRACPAWLPDLAYVAVLDGAVVGQATCTRLDVGGGDALALAPVSVHPARQGRGIGTRLLGWVNGVCDADNRAAGVILDTAAGHGASLYGRMGYREIAKVAVSNDRRQSVFFRPRLSLLA